ncbi:MAG: phosphopantetheine-binding protein [Paracoccaceae bacterium]
MTTLTALTAKMEQLLGKTAIDVDVPLSMLGVDSMNIVEMVIICQQIYLGVTNYEDIDITEHTTLSDLDAQMNALSVPA